METRKEVDEYIKKQNPPQREIVQRLRATILKVLPDIGEEIKMGVPWYAGKFYIVALKDHVNLGFSVQGLSEAEKRLFEGKGNLMRHLKFYSLMDVDETKVVELVELVGKKGTCVE
jgi:hypothetical protein